MSPPILALLGVVVVLGAVGGYLLLRPRRPAENRPDAHFNCPSCGRRLRYRASQAGRPGMCPRCRTALTFPRATPHP
jgi:hypothetical protein